MQQLCPPGGHILVSEPENKLLQYIMLDGERCLRETEAGEGIRECEGGRGGSSCIKMLRKALTKEEF